MAFAGAVWFMTSMPGPRRDRYVASEEPDMVAVAARLRAHVDRLCKEIGPRAAHDEKRLRETVDYLSAQFAALGYAPRRQRIEFTDFGFPNLEVEIPGSVPDAPIVVVGAHYDTVAESAGADDNASAVAVLLELARSLTGYRLQRTLRLVAFADEERGLAGSRFYAADLRAHGVQVASMVSLEMLGYYDDAEGSQRYPLGLLRYIYPPRGNFVAFVGNLASQRLVRRCVGTFRQAEAFPCEGMAAPELLRDVGRSDNMSFWLAGYPAVMATDTANFRNPHYHRPTDLPHTLQYDRMARVTRGLLSVLKSLASYA